MAEITASELLNIAYQDDADSYPFRKNFEALRVGHNQNSQAIAGLGTAASGAEISTARPYHASLLDRLNDTGIGFNYVKTGFVVSERSTPSMGVKVSAGKAQVGGSHIRKGYGSWARVGTTITITEENHGRANGQTVSIDVSSATTPLPLGEYTIGNVTANTFDITGVNSDATIGTCEHGTCLGTITAPAANRWDTVAIASDNSLSVVTGTSNALPVLPSLASTQKKLSHLYLTSAHTTIVNADCRDARKESFAGHDFIGMTEQIGTVKGWHKTFASVTLEEEYKECDGTEVTDPESPYYRLTIPDLNGGARFLKGAATSGTLEASANKLHNHTITDPTHTHATHGYLASGGAPQEQITIPTGGYSDTTVNTLTLTNNATGQTVSVLTGITLADQGATDAVPKNMTVVWIMRIK